jgi:hypothetical protein
VVTFSLALSWWLDFLGALPALLVVGFVGIFSLPARMFDPVTKIFGFLGSVIGAPFSLVFIVQDAMTKLLASPKRIDWQLAKFSVRTLTGLAVFLAGRERPLLRDEWRAHLAGESGHDPITWYKARAALGFVASSARFRLADAADLTWRPVDAVLASRTLSNLFVWGPVIVMLFAIVHHDGRFGLVADVQDPACMGAFLYGVIRTGRWWRGVKPPEPKARRAKE